MYQPIHNSIKEGVDNNSIINLPDQGEKPNPVTIFFNEKPQILESNIAISFDINIRSICNYGWQQVIGVTPDKNGADKRVLGIWFEPNSTTLHIRTATTSNGINITDSNSDIGGNKINLNNYIGKFVNICVIGNLNDNSYTHTFTVYVDGILKITTTIPRCWYPIVTKQVYIMTQYKNSDGNPSYYSFNGRLGNVVFLSSNSSLTYNKVKEYIPSFYTDSFTNISNTYKEGMTEKIIGIGVAPNISDYEPIKDSENKPVCPVTTLYENQDNTNYSLLDENKNFKINEKSIPICSFEELLKIEEIILKKINEFNADYSNYMIYKYNKNHTGGGDSQPQLNYVNPTDDSSSLHRYDNILDVTKLTTYKDLSNSLKTYDNILNANAQYYSSNTPPLDYKANTRLHNTIKQTRNDLDNKLFELNNNQNTIHRESTLLMDSSIYVTILWTTLATSLVYYMFVHI